MNKYILSLLLFIPLSLSAQDRQEIRFDTLNVNKYGLTFRNGVKLDLSYQFIYPTNDTPEIQKVRDLMIQDFFMGDSIMSLDDAVSRYERAIINDYASQLPNTTHQYHSQYSAVRIINDKVLVLMIQSYVYMGGNHGLEPTSYGNYDFEGGERITLDMLFRKEKEPELLELIKEGLIPLIGNNENAFVTDNFMLLPKGITFCFNDYWVSSYADGTVRVTLPYSKIKHLLNQSAHKYFY